MIPLSCPSCRSLRISGSRTKPHCKECGRYLSQKSLSRQRHKRAVLGCDGRKNAVVRTSQHNNLNFLNKK